MSSPNALLYIYFLCYVIIVLINIPIAFNGGDKTSAIVISSISTNESQS